MSKVIEMFGQFSSEEEKNAFIEAQFATITNQNKQIEQLKAEKLHLEILLRQSSVPTIGKPDERPTEEQICREQLRLLNEVSKSRELTAEEARKVDIYAKILTQSLATNKNKTSSVDGKSVEELLKLVGPDNG